VTFTEITPDHFQAHNVVLPPLYTWDLLGSRASTYKLQAGEPLQTLFQEWEVGRCILESRLQLVGILELFGVEAVEYAIKVFTEFGSCHVVPLCLTCELLYLCQGLYPQDLSCHVSVLSCIAHICIGVFVMLGHVLLSLFDPSPSLPD